MSRGQDTKIPQSSGPYIKVGDEVVHKELGDRMERAATTASSLEAEQDSGGTDCLPTATIFEKLTQMSAKSTALNEFSSSMASLIICLATNQNFNLSKYIFDAMFDDTQRRSDNKTCLIQMMLHGDEVNVDMPVGEKQEQSAKEREVDTSVEDGASPTTIEEITLA
ncbi:hypothetical protein Tco_0990142 [Tanacetum coccineum]|uniref:Uncharacterized protein n=1 Tax=Tanacetum coccineum TaxID=301880 RepID=A0ABQ5EWA7_9ASTR